MGFWKKPLDVMQTVLDVMGMIPVVGSVADGTNAAISLARGKYEEAALSTLAMIPIVGDAAGAAKIGKNLSKISDLPKQLEQNIYRKTTTGASRKLLTPEQINELRQREIRKLEFEASKRCLRNTCFPSGTLVHTKDGKIPIEQIEAGMMVYAQNIETGERGYQEVLSVSQTSVRKLFHIYLGDIEIQSTAMHRMYVYERGFVTAQDLVVGDQLVYMEDGTQKQIPIDNITVQFYKIPVTVHNFKVNKWHTYMVGELGFLVHNGERKCTLKTRDKGESGRKLRTDNEGGKTSTGYTYWNQSVQFEGNKVYQRNDLFDPNQVSSWRRGGKIITGTNIERMTAGNAPIGYDGKPINLHHLLQTPDGAIAEVSNSFHEKYYSTIHMNTGQSPSLIDRNQFGSWASKYWKNRALDFK